MHVKNVSTYTSLKPIGEAIKESNRVIPVNSLPKDTNGTVIGNAKLLPEIKMYNTLGEIVSSAFKEAIAYA